MDEILKSILNEPYPISFFITFIHNYATHYENINKSTTKECYIKVNVTIQ